MSPQIPHKYPTNTPQIQYIFIHVIIVHRNIVLKKVKVDIPKHTMRKIQNTVHGKVPQLIKYKFQTMFLKDKLSTQIKNLDSWIMEFTRLDRFRGLNG